MKDTIKKDIDKTKIKPIPEYIKKKIIATDKKVTWYQEGHVRFYAYITKIKNELTKITVAVKTFKKELYMKQVAVHVLNYSRCLVKDLEYSCYLGMGWRVGWHAEGIQSQIKEYETPDWETADSDYYDPDCIAIFNKNIITKTEKYKYSAIQYYNGNNIFKYLNLYEKYPQLEYLIKVGPKTIALSKQILDKCSKDKKFCKWVISNKEQLNNKYYYINTIFKAYKTGKELDKIQKVEEFRKNLYKYEETHEFTKEFSNDIEKLYDYIHEQNTNEYSYMDYFKACKYLNIDMNIPKNRYPHEFKKWHDIRIDQYTTAKAKEKEALTKQLNEKFIKVAEKYTNMELKSNKKFICIIAKSKEDLINEGKTLHHCVGRMNYDQKFAREETLIFFIRNKETPDIPFVTLEYSTTSNKILQCYGEHDSKPNKDVLNYAQKTWLPYANKQIKAIAA